MSDIITGNSARMKHSPVGVQAESREQLWEMVLGPAGSKLNGCQPCAQAEI